MQAKSILSKDHRHFWSPNLVETEAFSLIPNNQFFPNILIEYGHTGKVIFTL